MIDRQRLEAVIRSASDALGNALPEALGVSEVGFVLLLFDFGARGSLAYASNSGRADVIRAVKEWLAYQEAGVFTDPPGERGQS